MKELKKLPLAIEVCIWLRSARASSAADYSSADTINSARVYRQVVNLPMALLSESEAAAGEGVSSELSTTDGSSSGDSSSGSGSAFGDE
jgi:hypothetical protein